MKDLNSDQLIQVSGGDMTAEHGIAGALGGGLGGAPPSPPPSAPAIPCSAVISPPDTWIS